MKVISREQLRAKLERGDDFKLVMTMNHHIFEQMHIPGSLNFPRLADVTDQLSPDDEIVVYSANPYCRDSIHAYLVLRAYGYERLYRYAGGLADWREAGYPLEGRALAEGRMDNVDMVEILHTNGSVAYP